MGDIEEADGEGVKGECEGDPDPHSLEFLRESAGDFRLRREGEVFLRNSLQDKIYKTFTFGCVGA